MIKRILLGVSDGPVNRSLNEMSVQLALACQASLTGLAIEDTGQLQKMNHRSIGVYSHQVKEQDERISRADKHAHNKLTDLENQCKLAGVSWQGIVERGDVLNAAINAWRFSDLLLISAKPWLLGADKSSDETTILKIIAAGVRPVIAVPKGAPAMINKIIIGLSSSLESAKAMKHLVQLGIFPDTELHLVTSDAPKSGESAEELLSQAADYCSAHGYETTTAKLDGPGGKAILDEVENVGADMIVMGSSYKRFLFNEKFGSHATTILQHSGVSVFISH